MTPGRVVAAIGIVGLLVWLVGCEADGPDLARPTTTVPSAEPTVEVPGLTATLEQYREDEIQGFMSVQTTNRSSSTVQFQDLRVRWAGIADTAPYVKAHLISPGVTFDQRVLQGEAVCGDPSGTNGPAPDGSAVAIGHASIDGAPPVVVAIPIDDSRSILPRVFERSCQEQHLRWAADLHFGERWTPSTTPAGQPALLGTIELRRRHSDRTLTVTRIDGSVLLRINAVTPADPVAVLEPGADTATIPILVEQSGNCAAHALAESKKTFIIPIGFAIGDEDPLAYVIAFDTPSRPTLNRMINESCGVG